MNCVDVLWESGNSHEPRRLVSELDENRLETRKLEFFRSGAVGSASMTHETGRTALGSEAVRSLEEINADTQFVGRAISTVEFERLWSQYGRRLDLFDVAELIGNPPDVPNSLVGSRIAILLVYEAESRLAYDVECVAEDGSTLWQGLVAREYLRLVRRNGD